MSWGNGSRGGEGYDDGSDVKRGCLALHGVMGDHEGEKKVPTSRHGAWRAAGDTT